MMPEGFVTAGPVVSWCLRRLGLVALVLPWRRVWVLPGWEVSQAMIVHERVHLDQIDRLGPWRFSAVYLWGLVRHGYRGNPLEREAYAVSDAIERGEA